MGDKTEVVVGTDVGIPVGTGVAVAVGLGIEVGLGVGSGVGVGVGDDVGVGVEQTALAGLGAPSLGASLVETVVSCQAPPSGILAPTWSAEGLAKVGPVSPGQEPSAPSPNEMHSRISSPSFKKIVSPFLLRLVPQSSATNP